jgi:integrase/recombinase XerC
MAKNYLIERYVEHLTSQDKSQSTIISYRSDLYLFAKWFEQVNHEELKAHTITPTDLRAYKQYLIDYPFKPMTINRKISVINLFVIWLLDTDRIKSRIPLPKLVKLTQTAPKWLDKNQQHFMLRHLEKHGNERDLAIVRLLLNTGLRVNELISLQWSDVSLSTKKGMIHIRYSKAARYRDIPLNKDARFALTALGYSSKSKSSEPIFEGQKARLDVRGVQLLLKRRFKHTDLDFISPHILRHTFCKNLMNAGVSLEKVALLAGHESLDTTKVYCQPSFNDLTESVERIGEQE